MAVRRGPAPQPYYRSIPFPAGGRALRLDAQYLWRPRQPLSGPVASRRTLVHIEIRLRITFLHALRN